MFTSVFTIVKLRNFMYVLTATPEMADVFQRLCHMYPESGVGMVGLGSVLLHQKEFIMARALLQKGTV